ncbi:MAG: S41 family peptidase [Planctomycetes bacterium]|nr:S41 family peptidase [Planctomycetota bacterium]
MTTRRISRISLLSALLLLTLVIAPSRPAARADSGSSVADDLTRLAEHGTFDQVLARLKDSPDLTNANGVPALIKDIESYETARAAQAQVRRKDFDKVVARMNRQAQAGRLEDAVFSAVEASTLADSSVEFRKDPPVVDLIKKTEAAATAAQKQGDWVEALNIYRALDLLFDDYATYHVLAKQASLHVRVLRIYAPDHLETLLKKRAARLKKDRAADALIEKDKDEEAKPAAPSKLKKKLDRDEQDVHVDKEPWQERLKDVDPTMLRTTLAQASRKHLTNRGYAGLLRGALDSLTVLIDSPEVAESFPGLKDPKRVQGFRDAIATARADVDRNAADLNYLDAAGIIDQVIAASAKTVELPEAVIVYEMTDGAVDTLDEFSAIIWPHETEAFGRNFKGKFYGVGIQISEFAEPETGKQRLMVVSPIKDGPAIKAGIRAGDIIAAVDGVETAGWSLDKAVATITGEKGTDVMLGIERRGAPDRLPFKLVRDEVKIESIKGWSLSKTGGWDYYIDPTLRIGYVRLSQFIPQSADDLDAAINQMEKAGGVNALILDLRFNPGGLLASAVEVVNRFVREGPIVSTVGPDDSKNSEYRARPDRAHATFPVVVLVNQGSASASEIVSGALQDYSRALIVGSRSFGKFSVQDVFPIESGKAYLKLTTQHYKLPSGRSRHRDPGVEAWGIEPDLVVKMTDKQVLEALEVRQSADVIRNADAPVDPQNPVHQASELLDKSLDPQLQAALLVLKTRLVASGATVAQK